MKTELTYDLKVMFTEWTEGFTAELGKLDKEVLRNLTYNGLPLLHCAVWRANTEVITMLLNCGADVNEVDINGRTTLSSLNWCYTESNLIAKWLFNHGANIAVRDKDGDTPIYKCAESRQITSLGFLLAHTISNNIKLSEKEISSIKSLDSNTRNGNTRNGKFSDCSTEFSKYYTELQNARMKHSNHWDAIYFSAALDCDAPIIEALLHSAHHINQSKISSVVTHFNNLDNFIALGDNYQSICEQHAATNQLTPRQTFHV